MKAMKVIKFMFIAIFAMLLSVSCEKEEVFEDIVYEDILKAKPIRYVSNFVSDIPTDVSNLTDYILIAGKTEDVGTVSIGSNATHIYVKIDVGAEYQIAETHVFLGELANIPVNKKGNPVIGHYPYKYSDDPAVSVVIHEIPKTEIDGVIEIAAVHAVVINEEGTYRETAWGAPCEYEGTVVFAMKTSLASITGGYNYGVSQGEIVSPECTASWTRYFGYQTVDLSTFLHETFELVHVWQNRVIGEVEVVFINGVLSFTITSTESEGVAFSYLFVGEDASEIPMYDNGCPAYSTLFPYSNIEAGAMHYYEVSVGEPVVGGTVESATRWTYYIDGLIL